MDKIRKNREIFQAKCPHLLAFYHCQNCDDNKLVIPNDLKDIEKLLSEKICDNAPWKSQEDIILQHTLQEMVVLYDTKWIIPVLYPHIFSRFCPKKKHTYFHVFAKKKS